MYIYTFLFKYSKMMPFYYCKIRIYVVLLYRFFIKTQYLGGKR